MIFNILGVLVIGGLCVALMCVNAVEGYDQYRKYEERPRDWNCRDERNLKAD